MKVLATLAFGLGLSACAAAEQLTAAPADYEAYRRVRLAGSVEQRLAHSWRYLQALPDGRFRPEVRAWFLRNEPRYIARCQDDLGKLEAYLKQVPDGPRAADVADRIGELRTALEIEQRRARELGEEARGNEETLAAAQRLRRDLVQSFVGWTARLAKISSWGQPTPALDHELIFEFRLAAPRGRCAGRRCTKTLSMPYAVPELRRVEPRHAIFDVVLLLDERGGVRAAALSGPELFTRVAEAAEMRAIRPEDGLGRAEAIARVADLVNHALEPLLPAASCAREAVSPAVVVRACRGLEVRMTAAEDLESEDRVEFAPSPAP